MRTSMYDYVKKSVIQMVMKEGYTDRAVIADELGVSRKHISRTISKIGSPLREKIEQRLK